MAPAPGAPRKYRAAKRAQGIHARVRGAHLAGTRHWHGPSVAVRETADGAHRPSRGTDPVRYASVDTATQRPAARQGDTRRDKKKTARIAENSQLAGRFPRVWQVLGSNQRRLSRRFYSPPLRPEAPTADQRLCASRSDSGPPPSAMRPWTQGSWGLEIHGRGTDGEGGSGYADRPARLLASDLAIHDA
jgi:hypothetical protein